MQGFLSGRGLDFNWTTDSFSHFPEGSLGQEYLRHLHRFKIDPAQLGDVPVTSSASYLEHLVLKTHDIWHLITGFDTSVQGELGLQAFMLRQMRWPFATLAIAGGFLTTLIREPEKMSEVLATIVKGYNLGGQMKPLILVDWNQHWEKPLSKVLSELRQ